MLTRYDEVRACVATGGFEQVGGCALESGRARPGVRHAA